MKKMGAKKVAAVGYGVSPSSSEAAKATETYGAKAAGLEGVYLNTSLVFGVLNVGPVVLGIKNSGADGLYLPLDADTNFAIVQGLQQNGVEMKANLLATGYSQDLLEQPIARTITANDVMFSAYRPVELGGKVAQDFQANLKKYSGLTGVPDYGTYTGYIVCDLAIHGLEKAGKDLTRQGFVDGIRNGGDYDAAGLTCTPMDYSVANFGKVDSTSCTWFVSVKDGKFVVLNKGKPLTGKLVGDPKLIAEYETNKGGVVETTASRRPPPWHPDPLTEHESRGSRFAGSPCFQVEAGQFEGGPLGTSRYGPFLSCVISRGMPSTRSLMLFRAILVVPPPMPEV